ncbi:hypothetical protein L9F63_007323, partial [Diploptera punctata]
INVLHKEEPPAFPPSYKHVRVFLAFILLILLFGVDTRRFALNCGGHLQWRVLLGVFPVLMHLFSSVRSGYKLNKTRGRSIDITSDAAAYYLILFYPSIFGFLQLLRSSRAKIPKHLQYLTLLLALLSLYLPSMLTSFLFFLLSVLNMSPLLWSRHSVLS